MLYRLIANWVYGAFLAGSLLLLLAPLLWLFLPPLLVLIFLHLPAYMIHQYEEHDSDRFRLFVNRLIGHGKDVLQPTALFLINVVGVWGLIAVSLYLVATINTGYGLVAVYLVLVNALVHIGQAIVSRSYNPELATAIAFFIPLGLYTLNEIQASGNGTVGMHALVLSVAIGIHAAIVGYILYNKYRAGAVLPV
jgi:hypothetical protein